MLDWFVILTPLLVLGVIALLGFVGCDSVFGINSTGLLPPLELDQLAPNVGASLGGTKVTMTGVGFTGVSDDAATSVTQVTFGGVPAASFVVVSDSEIDAVSPAHLVGTVDVIAVTTVQNTNSLPFNYVAITFVQMQANSTASGPSIQVTLPSPTAAGNILIAAISHVGTGSITVTDNSGNAFTSVGNHAWYQGQAEMFYRVSTAGGTVTVKALGPSGQWNICLSEYTGGVQLGAVSGSSSPNTGAVPENISGVAVTPAAGNVVYVVAFTLQGSNPNLVAGAAFTGHSFAPDAAVLAEDITSAVSGTQIVATASPPTMTFLPWVVLAAEIQT